MEELEINYLENRFDKVHFIDPKHKKSFRWLSAMVANLTLHAHPFVDAQDALEKRKFESHQPDEASAKLMIDPEEGKAEFFSSDWSRNPIMVHLDSIVDANLAQSLNSAQMVANDALALNKKQKENRKIIERDKTRDILNMLNNMMGIAEIPKNADPYKYIEMQVAKGPKGGEEGPTSEPKGDAYTTPDLVNAMKQMIEDDESLAIFNEMIQKIDISIPYETGMKYYTELNGWDNIEEQIHQDIRHFAKYSIRVYTSVINGELRIQYLKPEQVFTTPYTYNDLKDGDGQYTYMFISYNEFMRMIGATLTPDEIRDVLEENINYQHFYTGTIDSIDQCSSEQISNMRIRVKYSEVVSQDIDVWSDGEINGNCSYKKMPFDWEPDKKQNLNRVEKFANQIYWAYSLPLSTSGGFPQEERVIAGGKLHDRYGEGDNMQFSRGSFIMYHKKTKVTMTSIEQTYGKTLDTLWHKFQNEIANIQPSGNAVAIEAIQHMVKLIDKKGTGGQRGIFEIAQTIMKRYKQSGDMIYKSRDEDGNQLPAPFSTTSEQHENKALGLLQTMGALYELTKQSLGINDITEGATPPARTPMGAINAAQAVSNNSRYYMKQMKDNLIVQLNYRIYGYMKSVVQAGGKRYERLKRIIGETLGDEAKLLDDIPLHEVGFRIENYDTNQLIDFTNQLTMSMLNKNKLSETNALMIQHIENPKMKMVYLRLLEMRARKDAQAAQQAEKMAIMEARQAQLEDMKAAADIEIYKERGLAQIKSQLTTQENQEKTQGQIATKGVINENRKDEMIVKKNLDVEKKAEEIGIEERNKPYGE